MSPASAPPSPPCEPTTLLLPRRLLGRDCGKWRTVLRLNQQQVEAARSLAAAATGIDAATEWRIVADIAVTTEVWKSGRLWWDGGTMRWFDVDEDVTGWLAGSCKTTAFWLLGLPEVTDGETYSIRYRTVVTEGGEVVRDTTMVQFDGLSYASVIAFQRWALSELAEMVNLFEAKHRGESVTAPRRWVRQLWQLLTGAVAQRGLA